MEDMTLKIGMTRFGYAGICRLEEIVGFSL